MQLKCDLNSFFFTKVFVLLVRRAVARFTGHVAVGSVTTLSGARRATAVHMMLTGFNGVWTTA